MAQPTMVTTDEQLAVGRISTVAWQAAVEHLSMGQASSAGEELLLDWRAAGVIDADFELAPDWAAAIDVAARGPLAFTMVARQDDVAFLSQVHADPTRDLAVTITLRSLLESVDGKDRIELVHPQSEVATSPMARLWPLLRRVIPPVEHFRAEPSGTQQEEQLHLDSQSLASADDSTTTILVHAVDATGSSHEVLWYVLSDKLHRLEPRTGKCFRVAPGDVALRLPELLTNLA